jgi:hypothetical protein
MLTLTVYCNCFESGIALPPPKSDWKVETHDDGMVEAFCPKPEDIPHLNEWWHKACPHPDRKAFHDVDFVNIAGAAMMRDEIGEQGAYPILLEKVFPDGIHDNYLVPTEVEALKQEIDQLDYDKLSATAQAVIDKIKQAIVASQEMQKPISF